jgi:hypothetical protein
MVSILQHQPITFNFRVLTPASMMRSFGKLTEPKYRFFFGLVAIAE